MHTQVNYFKSDKNIFWITVSSFYSLNALKNNWITYTGKNIIACIIKIVIRVLEKEGDALKNTLKELWSQKC